MDPFSNSQSPLSDHSQSGGSRGEDAPELDQLARYDECDPEERQRLAAKPGCGDMLEMLERADAYLESRLPVSKCPSSEHLYDYGRGPGYRTLSGSARAAITDHLSESHACQCASFVEALRQSPPLPLDLTPPAEGEERPRYTYRPNPAPEALPPVAQEDSFGVDQPTGARKSASKGPGSPRDGAAEVARAAGRTPGVGSAPAPGRVDPSAENSGDGDSGSGDPFGEDPFGIGSGKVQRPARKRRAQASAKEAGALSDFADFAAIEATVESELRHEFPGREAPSQERKARRSRNSGPAHHHLDDDEFVQGRSRTKLLRFVSLAAAAGFLALATTFWQSRNNADALAQEVTGFPTSPLLRGDIGSPLLFPRGPVLSAEAQPGRMAFASVPTFELQPQEGAASYRVILRHNNGDAFSRGFEKERLTSSQPILTGTHELAEGAYTWEAWAVIDGLDRFLGERDFQIRGDRSSDLAQELSGLGDQSALKRLHEEGYLTDARQLARSLPQSAERDAYLRSHPGR